VVGAVTPASDWASDAAEPEIEFCMVTSPVGDCRYLFGLRAGGHEWV